MDLRDLRAFSPPRPEYRARGARSKFVGKDEAGSAGSLCYVIVFTLSIAQALFVDWKETSEGFFAEGSRIIESLILVQTVNALHVLTR